MEDGHGLERMLTGLLDASHRVSFEQLPSVVSAHARLAGLDEVLIYLVDLRQRVLRPITSAGEDAEVRVEGTMGGRAFQELRVLTTKPDAPAQYSWVPLLDGTERLGVMRVRTAGPAEEPQLGRMRHLASLVALMLVSTRPYSDSYARLVRTERMNVAAEMEWNLLPPLTFAGDRVAIGAVVEPAYEVGGDAFDYATAGDTVHLAVFDAMGHDVAAGLAANLAIAACRNQRRHGVPLAELTQGIEAVLLSEFGEDARSVTAIMAELDTVTGRFTWVNRGHHPPVVIRHGRWITTLSCPPSHPIGMDLGLPVSLCVEQLEPGDRVLLYTDGIIEARDRQGREFGLERFVDFVIRHTADGLPIPETLRRLISALLTHHAQPLQDDATVLLLDWHGPSSTAD
ncbi:PP2C family protein-serine/threonine phosphatase [Actinocorallia aurea]